LTQAKQNLFIVGDDDQSIYSFRGAVVENMTTFQSDYPNHELVKLEQNYRCSATILDAANKVIACNKQRMSKVLRTDNPAGDKITLYTANDDMKEASYIVSEILKLQSKGHALNDIAILYRTNSQSDIITQSLQQAQIPFHIAKGQRFYDRKEIKLVLCYLQLALDCNDSGSFDYAVNTPIRSVGLATKQKIMGYATQNQLSYWQACEAMISANLLIGKALQGIREFMALLNNAPAKSWWVCVKGLKVPPKTRRLNDVSIFYTDIACRRLFKMMLKILLNHIFCHFANGRTKISSCPKMPAPIAFF
jgi:DNA helicase-2/ATP-dependent DNA helicase PcrA